MSSGTSLRSNRQLIQIQLLFFPSPNASVSSLQMIKPLGMMTQWHGEKPRRAACTLSMNQCGFSHPFLFLSHSLLCTPTCLTLLQCTIKFAEENVLKELPDSSSFGPKYLNLKYKFQVVKETLISKTLIKSCAINFYS